MKVVILAGGYGTRLSEETEVKPKPMVEVGDKPILWHIMKHYASFGHNEFYIALGYKSEYIKRFFMEFMALSGSMTVNLANGKHFKHEEQDENWTVHLIETGTDTNTGGRIKRMQPYLEGESFMLTYGDGVSSIDLDALEKFHKGHGKLATVSAVRPPARFGGLELDGDTVLTFAEKPQMGEGWINGGFMVLEPSIFNYIDGDAVNFEQVSLECMVKERQLMAYRHHGFWQCMDTLRDKRTLDALWTSGDAPWKLW